MYVENQRVPDNYYLLLEVNTFERRADKPAGTYLPLKGKPLGSHMVGWKYTSTMIGWIIGGRVH